MCRVMKRWTGGLARHSVRWTMLSQVPLPARVLGLAGLIPFIAGAVGVWVLSDLYAAIAMTAQMAYGAVILSFLGAVHWGYAMHGELAWPRLLWSVAPALVAWVALLVTPLETTLILIVSFVLAFYTDARAARSGLFPRWYLDLRKVLTLGVVLSLAATLVRIYVSGL